MALNNELYAQFSHNPVCLYNRALLLEQMSRHHEALRVWQHLIDRIQVLRSPSNHFLAECYYHLAKIYRQSGEGMRAWKHLIRAAQFMQAYDPSKELKGPYWSPDEIKASINRALQEWQPTRWRGNVD